MSALAQESGFIGEAKHYCTSRKVLLRGKVVAHAVTEKVLHCVESLYSFMYRLSPFWRVTFVAAIVLLLWSNYIVLNYVFKNHARDVEVLEARKCPACFGRRLCTAFVRGEISFAGLADRLPLLASWTQQKTFRGYYNNKQVVMKRLGASNTFDQLDRWLCERAHYAPSCGVHAAMYKQLSENGNVKMQPYDFRSTPQDGAGACMTRRLLDVLIGSFAEREDHELIRYEELLLKYTMMVNGEPLLLQAFTSERGYPFCTYVGACGRWVVQEHCGTPLTDMLSDSFADRVELAYQVLQIASRLSQTMEEFSFYLLDARIEHFVVQISTLTGRRTVRLADLERVVVVDRQDVQRRQPAGYERLLEAERYEDDLGSTYESDKTKQDELCRPLTTCPWYSPTALCDRLETDLNYFSVCRDVLSGWTDARGTSHRGLLHDIPAKIDENYRLSHWLRECVHPAADAHEGRLVAKERLLSILGELRNLRNMEL